MSRRRAPIYVESPIRAPMEQVWDALGESWRHGLADLWGHAATPTIDFLQLDGDRLW